MIVLKFGGSSVGSVENLQRISHIIGRQKENYIVVVSAFSGVTNQLEELGEKSLQNEYKPLIRSLTERHTEMVRGLLSQDLQNQLIAEIEKEMLHLERLCESIYILGEFSDKTKSRILSKGELFSSKIIYAYLQREGYLLEYLNSSEIVRALGNPLNAEVDFETTYRQCSEKIRKDKNYIAPGFVATNAANEPVVLGRGGSDYTASVLACGVGARCIELWSDVNGMQNANPKIVKQARAINQMSYEEAFEMAYFGAKVIYPPSIKPAMQKHIPVWLKNTLQPDDKGTLIMDHPHEKWDKVLGVSTLPDISLITVSGVGLAGKRGSARRVFQALEMAGVNIILITQSCSEQSICFGVRAQDSKIAAKALEEQFASEITLHQINPIESLDNQVILALIGDNMRYQVGLSGKVFSALGENNVNVKAIAQGASERNISVVIDAKDEHKAVNVIHERFFQDAVKKVNLFVIGVGNVGSQFIDIVFQQQAQCRDEHRVNFSIALVADSKRYVLDTEGLGKASINLLKTHGKPYSSVSELVKIIKEVNLRNSIVVDNTASEEVSHTYHSFFDASISVATCNKIAGSSPLSNFASLIRKAKDKNCFFQYETSVGAALPIIKTIQNLNIVGDKIHRIEAVVSGSLNFIFNHYTMERSFAEVVKQAQHEGYTEPDPRIDLSGLDVIRKILILARESGYAKELEDVSSDSFLPPECNKATNVEEFYRILEEKEDFFRNLYRSAAANHAKLKVIARLQEGKLHVSLQQVGAQSPFYQLDGKDNIVALYTQLYNPEPLIVKGAGAGAKVTASGVFSDVMYIVNRK